MYNKEFFDSLSKLIVIKGSKKSKYPFKHNKNTYNNRTIESILKQGYNVAIRTGKTNNLTVVDLDVGFNFPFNIEELCKTTYYQKSASGGIHLFYQYDKDIKQGQNGKIHVDTRNDENGYIMFDGSKFKGKKYEGQNELIPSKIPQDVKQFLLDNGYDNSIHGIEMKEKKNIDSNIKLKDMEITKDKNLYIPKSHLKQILDDKPLSFFNDVEFWKFTTIMKYLDAYDLWDEFNKKRDKYDLNKNIEIWNSVNPNRCNINLLIDLFHNKDISGYYNLKHLPKFSLESEKINKTKLGYDFIQENINYIIKSDTGTGKTTSVKHFLNKTNDNFISIVSRKSLGQEQYNNFNEDDFLKCDYYEFVDFVKDKDNIIIQLDSILRIHRNIDLSQYILVLDEFESIIHYLFTSSTLKTKRVLIFMKFIEILKECKNFICIDADITNKSIEFISTFINRNYKLFENSYKHNKGVNAYEIQTEDLFIEKLKTEKKFLCCCDSAHVAEGLKSKLDDESVICITSNNDEYYNFDEYDKIIYSPKVIYGIDSSMERSVYCFYKEHTINTKQMVQQIARCRNITNLYYHFVKKTYNPNKITYEEVLKRNNQIIDYGIHNENKLIETNFNMIDIQLEKDYLKLFSKFEYEDICYNTNKFCHFMKLLDERGFILKTYRMMKEKKKQNNNEKIKDEIDNVDEYTKEFFSKQRNKKILEIIGLNLNADFNTIRDNIEIISRYNFVQEYLNIKHFFFDNLNDNQLLQKLDNQNEFILGKVSNNNQKLRLLLQLKNMTGCIDRNNISSTKLLNQEQINQFNYEYKMIFEKNKYYDEKFDFSNLYNQDKVLNKLYKKIFTKNITKSKMKRLDKEMRYFYFINDEEFNHFKELYDVRMKKQKDRENKMKKHSEELDKDIKKEDPEETERLRLYEIKWKKEQEELNKYIKENFNGDKEAYKKHLEEQKQILLQKNTERQEERKKVIDKINRDKQIRNKLNKKVSKSSKKPIDVSNNTRINDFY